MIYLVSNQPSLFPEFDTLSVEDSLEILRSWSIIQFDTETIGLNAHLNTLLCAQFGNKQAGIEIVVDTLTIDLRLYKDILEQKLLVIHNAKFDIQQLFKLGIIPLHIWDTMIIEQLIYLGWPDSLVAVPEEYKRKKYTWPYKLSISKENITYYKFSYSLAAVLRRYTGLEMDKSIRDEIANRGLDSAVIQYAALDVVYLEDIMEAQKLVLQSENSLVAAEVENNAVPFIAYMDWCGVKLDVNKWKSKMNDDEEALDKALTALNDFVVRTESLKQFTYVDTQGDLFTGFDLTPKVKINWKSSKQVVPICKALGFNTTVIDKKTGEEKDSTLEKVLAIQKGINDEFLKLYFDYQEHKKTTESFGQGHIDAINPITNRIHTKFNQLGCDSGRLSCGGGLDKDLSEFKHLASSKCKLLNLQQLPHDAKTRSCFVAEEGNKWCSIDFSSEEARLTADISQDVEYYKEFTERTGDTHAMFAWACYEPECRALGCESAAEVKKKAKPYRDKVKSAEFAYTFGASADTISKTAGIKLSVAEKMVEDLDAFFAGLTEYKKQAAKEVKQLGYIVINPITGHRLHWWDFEDWKKEQASYTRDFWDDYKLNHKNVKGDKVALKVREHFQAADKYAKLGLNSRTQGE